jgi:hypothetical protein
MGAIDWVAGKAKQDQVEFITVSADEADKPEEVGTYEVSRKFFSGYVPYRMMKELQKSPIVKTSEISQTLLVDLKKCFVEFSHTEYRKIAA